jgi:hypothetical protein
MKQILLFTTSILLFAACSAPYQNARTPYRSEAEDYNSEPDPPITQSLFNDKNATISEENIQKILDGNYQLPEKLRVAIVKLESKQFQPRYFWLNEEYLKNR